MLRATVMYMNMTEMLKKPGVLPVVFVGAAFVAVDLGVAMPAVLKEMQSKAKAGGLDIFDWFILACITVACIGKSMAAFMNKSFTRLTDQLDEQRKVDTALTLKRADEREQAQRDFGAKP